MLDELRYRFASWIAYRQTLASLRQVPDSTLADAGISRRRDPRACPPCLLASLRRRACR
ncbi:MAG: DUF1127 domain-containing protein [Mesorhizobium sp.]|nr:MAG: DUF1127 domain-containing protein [Mesorhizobium sp.]